MTITDQDSLVCSCFTPAVESDLLRGIIGHPFFTCPGRCSVETRTVKLTERLNAFIEEAVASGRYLDDGDVVREALRVLALRDWEDGTAPASAPVPAGATAPLKAA